VAFSAGLFSFLSPCVLPLFPSYLSFITGMSVDRLTGDVDTSERTRALGHSVAFVAGFTAVFVALGASFSAAGQFLLDYRDWIRIGGHLPSSHCSNLHRGRAPHRAVRSLGAVTIRASQQAPSARSRWGSPSRSGGRTSARRCWARSPLAGSDKAVGRGWCAPRVLRRPRVAFLLFSVALSATLQFFRRTGADRWSGVRPACSGRRRRVVATNYIVLILGDRLAGRLSSSGSEGRDPPHARAGAVPATSANLGWLRHLGLALSLHNDLLVEESAASPSRSRARARGGSPRARTTWSRAACAWRSRRPGGRSGARA
jgi:hypothetical protein